MTATGPDVQTSPTPPHALSRSELLSRFPVDEHAGLQSTDVESSRRQFGWNELASAPPESGWKRLLSQFHDLVIWILVVAAVVSGSLGEWVDAAAILAIVILNGVIGYLQEERAERVLAALKKLSAPQAKVLRDGVLRSLPAAEVVPGDILQLDAGDNVPADARLLRAFSLSIQEAALTGESVPVEKDAEACPAAEAPLGDRRNMVYLGTVVAAGKATALVVATGMKTELGRIAALLEGSRSEPTPLQRRLAELGRVLIVICLAIVALIFVLQVARGGPGWMRFCFP